MSSALNKHFIRNGLEIEGQKIGLDTNHLRVFADEIIKLLGEPTPRPEPAFFNFRKSHKQALSCGMKSVDYDTAATIVLRDPAAYIEFHKDAIPGFLRGWGAPAKIEYTGDKITWEMIEATTRETLSITGKRLGVDDGIIAHGCLQGIHTRALNSSIALGYHGLEKGIFKGLADFQDQCGIPLDQKIRGCWTRGKTISLEDVSRTLHLAHLIDGQRLSKNHGIVKYGPLAGEDCEDIDRAFRRGLRGLKDCGFKSLSDYADHLKIPRNVRKLEKVVNLRFTPEEAEHSFALHIEHDKKIPVANKEPIRFGKLAELGMTFAAANLHIARHEDFYGYSSMKEFVKGRCSEAAFWHVPDSQLARQFIDSVGIDYDAARHIAKFDVTIRFIGPPDPAHIAAQEKVADAMPVEKWQFAL